MNVDPSRQDKIIREWFDECENVMNHVVWPSQSQGLNPTKKHGHFKAPCYVTTIIEKLNERTSFIFITHPVDFHTFGETRSTEVVLDACGGKTS